MTAPTATRLFIFSVLALAPCAVHAQSGAIPAPVIPPLPQASAPPLVQVEALSITAHLQLSGAQIKRLDRLYSDEASRRAKSKGALTTGISPKLRGKALDVLSPVQRAQLTSLANDSRLRWREDAYSFLLLAPEGAAWPVASSSSPLDLGMGRPLGDTSNLPASAWGRGSVGVYGGYGYGGQDYGVYGNYGQGGVGVYGGVGRYGPSIGVGIGRVWGGRGW